MSAEASSITTNPNRTKKRLATTLIWAALIVEVYLLLNDVPILNLWQSGNSNDHPLFGQAIADLVTRKNSVHLQNPNQLIWEETKSGQPLFQDQSILTQEKSEAEIAFQDGTGLMVGENSLIKLERKTDETQGNRISISLLRGRMTQKRKTDLPAVLTGGPQVEVEIGNAKAILNDTSEVTLSSSGKESKIIVQGGEIRLQSPNGEISVGAGSEVTLGAKGTSEAAKTLRTPFTLLTPRGDESITANKVRTDGTQKVEFFWKIDTKRVSETPLEVEVSTQPDFNSSEGELRDARVGATFPPLKEAKVSIYLPVSATRRIWYWRVKALNSGITSAPEKFALESPIKAELVYPPTGTLLTREKGTDKKMDLSWKEIPDVLGYEVELKIGSETKIQKTGPHAHFYTIEPSIKGSVTWRVRGTLKSGKTDWSESRNLVIKELIPPPPPELLKPEVESQKEDLPKPTHSILERVYRSISEQVLSDAYAEEVKKRFRVRLKWKPVSGITKYKIQLSRTKGFTDVVMQADTDSPEWTWLLTPESDVKEEKFYYRVASVSDEGLAGKFSGAQRIVIPVHIPDLAQQKNSQVTVEEAPPEPVVESAPLQQKTFKYRYAGDTSWKADVGIGIGNVNQSSSATDISSVGLNNPYFHQRVNFQMNYTRTKFREDSTNDPGEVTARWSFAIRSDLASFDKSNAVRTSQQSKVNAVTFEFDAVHWVNSAGSFSPDPEHFAHSWALGLGLAVDRSFRWEKTGLQSVDARGGFSVGPLLYGVRNYKGESSLTPSEAGLRLALPLSGLATKDQWGIEGNFWSEWNLKKWQTSSFGLLLSADVSYLRWNSPNDTGVLAWNVWLAPSLRF
ncbi:FecR domain-containing protein [bacterium]|nr:FecR domain-containing protein [bacterium]